MNGDRYSQGIATLMAIILAWILNALITSTQKQRAFTYEMLDRLSALEVQVQQMQKKCDIDH